MCYIINNKHKKGLKLYDKYKYLIFIATQLFECENKSDQSSKTIRNCIEQSSFYEHLINEIHNNILKINVL